MRNTSRRSDTSISQITIDYPSLQVFAFSPNYMQISGLAVAQQVTVEFNNIPIKRYADALGNVTMPLSGAFQSFFSLTEFGDVEVPLSGIINSGSKSIKIGSEITVTIGASSAVLTFDIIWGALQAWEVEPLVNEIYQFGALPLTVTQTIGTNISVDNVDKGVAYGKDIRIAVNSFNVKYYTSSFIEKEYPIVSTTCEDGVYLRWLDIYGEYRYYLLKQAQSDISTKNGATFKYFPLSNDAIGTNPDLLKGGVQTKNITSNKTILCGEQNANDNVTSHLETLATSLKQWIWLTPNWVEVQLSDRKIDRKRLDGNRQIDFTVIMPQLYTQEI